MAYKRRRLNRLNYSHQTVVVNLLFYKASSHWHALDFLSSWVCWISLDSMAHSCYTGMLVLKLLHLLVNNILIKTIASYKLLSVVLAITIAGLVESITSLSMCVNHMTCCLWMSDISIVNFLTFMPFLLGLKFFKVFHHSRDWFFIHWNSLLKNMKSSRNNV